MRKNTTKNVVVIQNGTTRCICKRREVLYDRHNRAEVCFVVVVQCSNCTHENSVLLGVKFESVSGATFWLKMQVFL